MKKSAWMWWLFSSVLARVVRSDDVCVAFNLEEENAADYFASDLGCEDSPGSSPWQHSSYAAAADGVPLPHDASVHRLEAVAASSCSRTTRPLRVSTGGLVRVEVYARPAPGATVELTVLLQMGGGTFGVGYGNWGEADTGWHNLTISAFSDADEISVVFIGQKPGESMLLIDCFKYADDDELLETCELYPHNTPPNSNEVTDPEPCETFNLEGEEAEDDFAADRECESYNPWQHSSYAAANGVPLPHDAAEHHLEAVSPSSCSRTTRLLRVSAGGLLQVECYVRPASDTIVRLTVHLFDMEDGILLDEPHISSWDEYDEGWHNVTIQINTDGHQAYTVLIGEKEEESILILDSIQYGDDQEILDTCELYANNTPPNSNEVTDPEPCETFNLEGEEAEDDFAADRECESYNPWQHSSYAAANGVPLPHDAAEHHLEAVSPISCSRTTRLLRVSAGGLLQVECYVRPAPDTTVRLTVHLFDMEDGILLDEPHISSWDEYDEGWHNVTIQINTDGHQAYTVLIGENEEESILILDSIQYGDDQEILDTCELYANNTPPNSNEVTDPEPCETFNLEGEEAEDDFAADRECESYNPWQHSSYAAANGVPLPHDAAEHHLEAVSPISCSRTTRLLRVSAGGLLQVECYVRPAPDTTVRLTVHLFDMEDGILLDEPHISSWDEYDEGWHNVTIQINTDGHQAYTVLFGEKEEESILILDSIQYGDDQEILDTCELYVDNAPPNSNEVTDPEPCETFNLEGEEAEDDFAADRECESYNPWQHSSYAAANGVPLPHDAAEHHLEAVSPSSCSRTTRLLRVSAGGLLQVECYVRPVPDTTVRLTVHLFDMEDGILLDEPHISSWDEHDEGWHNVTIQITTDGDQAYIYYQERSKQCAVSRWNMGVLGIEHAKRAKYPGSPYFTYSSSYINILLHGEKDEESILLIDSLQYADSETCEIYPDTGTPPSVHTCVPFNLEDEEAEDGFASDLYCNGTPFGPWQHASYATAAGAGGVSPPHAAAAHHLAASAPGSCSRTTRPLRVSAGGLVRVHCYVRPAPGATVHLTVLLSDMQDGVPLDPPHASSWDEDTPGWHNVTVPITTDGHQSFMVFVGVVPDESILLIDSFSYVASEDLVETCEVYPSDSDDNPPAPEGGSSWLNALIISIVTIVGLVVLVVVGVLSYKLGQKRAVRRIPSSLYPEDVDLPPTVFVPRVTRAYNYPSNKEFRKSEPRFYS